MASSTVRVALRIRPLSPQEHAGGETECVTQLPGVPQIVIGADRAFTFDYVFSPEVSQEQVYDDAIGPLVRQFVQGYNATILAYGQTGSGKTFSMGTGLTISVTEPELQGVVPRAIGGIWEHLKAKSQKNPGFSFSVDVSFLELYNEDLVDLLNPRSTTTSGGRGPAIREDSRGHMVLVGVERKAASGENDIFSYLHQGALSRTTASTDMNHTSSRSHAIFTIYLTQQDRRSSLLLATAGSEQCEPSEMDGGLSIVSKMHFVDLAGSERIKRTGAAGDRAKEGISINAGLLALGNVISALGNTPMVGNGNGAQPSKRVPHVPYRDSKLTRLLQDSLGGNSQTLMLACISPSDKNSPESLNTIRYANRARNIRNKVAVNFDKSSSVELSMLKTEVARLRGELSKLKLLRRQSALTLNTDQGSDSHVALRHDGEADRLRRMNAELTLRLEQSIRQAAALEHERNELRSRVADLGGSAQSTPRLSSAVLSDLATRLGSAGDVGCGAAAADSADMMSQSHVLNTMDRELSEQAERHEHQIDSVRRHYESKLELVRESLVVVQKERDVALQRLANASKPASKLASKPGAAPGASSTIKAGAGSNRRALGLDSVAPQNVTPTKLRLPSRAATSTRHDLAAAMTPISRISSNAELRGSNSSSNGGTKSPTPLSRMGSSLGISALALGPLDELPATRRMQEEIERLRHENKQAVESSSAVSERLTLQIQEQAREIARLRRQHTGRRESHRYSLLPFKDNNWGAAKSGQVDVGQAEGSGPNLLRAAFIKAVVDNELQRCVQARQLLRERDSFLTEQDQLMNQQNDLLLSIQNLQQNSEGTSSCDDDGSDSSDGDVRSVQMRQITEKIEIIDAELHHLDLKVRDAEADIAQLAEAAPPLDDAGSLSASGLMAAPMIVNMSGLAMRMVEDVVRVDFRAFADLFQSLQQSDATGLTYLLMQDIIDHRLVALRDARERASLEEQAMDLRRTLLAMQKTALSAALAYERELGHAERKIGRLQTPPMHERDPVSESCDAACDGARSTEALTAVVSANDLVLDRSIYESVRDRGILLRSALISATDMPLGEDEAGSCTFPAARTGGDGTDNMSMEEIRGAKAHVADWSEGASDFTSASDGSGDEISYADNESLPSSSIYSKLSLVNPRAAAAPAAGPRDLADTPPAAPLGLNSSTDDTTTQLSFANASEAAGSTRSINGAHIRQQDTSTGLQLRPDANAFASASPVSLAQNILLSSVPRNQSTRSRHHHQRLHMARRSSVRKRPGAGPNITGTRASHAGGQNRRRGGSLLRKAKISLPIIPPEMLEYIDRRNPTAISVGRAPPLVASPEMLVEMGILSGDEYQSNVSAFASFDLRPKLAAAPSSADRPLPIRCQSIAPDSLAASPVDSSCTKVGSITTDASPQLYTPRSAGKIASRADVGQGVSGDSFRTEVASPESAMPARLSDSLSLLSAIVWSPMSNGTGGQSLLESTENIKSPQAHLTPQHLSPVSHHAPNIANGNHSAHGAQLEPGTAAESSDTRGSGSLTGHERSLSCGKLPDPQRPFSHPIDSHELLRPISVVSSFDISGDISVDEGKRHRFLSPTEQANASLFSMLDAAQTESSSSIGGEFAPPRNQVEPPSPARLVSAATDNGRLDKGRDAALAKPARIRRRALTAFAGDISDYSRGNAHAVNRSSTHSAQERPGGSRLSKLLSGIGLGAPKPKPPQKPSFILHDYYRVDANAAGQGKMTSTADVNRDRSNSDSTEARMARVRKVHSTIDGASAGISRFGRPYSAAAEK